MPGEAISKKEISIRKKISKITKITRITDLNRNGKVVMEGVSGINFKIIDKLVLIALRQHGIKNLQIKKKQLGKIDRKIFKEISIKTNHQCLVKNGKYKIIFMQLIDHTFIHAFR